MSAFSLPVHIDENNVYICKDRFYVDTMDYR